MAAPMYNVYVGSETGLLKGINIGKNTWDNLNTVTSVDKGKEVCSVCWDDQSEKKLHIGLKDKTIQTYVVSQNVFESVTSYDAGDGCLKCIAKYDDGLITAVDSGVVRYWKENELQTELNAGKDLHCMVQNQHCKNVIGTGGKENELKVWDINTSSNDGPIFCAKNVKNDWLNLRVPVWVTGIQFLEENKVMTGTGHHQIRVYDIKAQRRPVLDMQFDEYPISAVTLCPRNTNQVVVGNSRGNMALIDLRVGKMIHLFKGFAGGIRSLQCHKTLPLVASCGLDRFLRIHDLESKQCLHKFYLKSRLNCLVFTKRSLVDNVENDNDEEGTQSEEIIDSDQESGDEIWDNMEIVKTKTKRKINMEQKLESNIQKKRMKVNSDEKSKKNRKKKKSN